MTGESVLNTTYYHIIDHLFGVYGSNNTYRYTGQKNVTGPPHNFALFMGSEEPAPIRRINWYLNDTIIVLLLSVLLFLTRKLYYSFVLDPFTNSQRFKHMSSLAKTRLKENIWFFTWYLFATVGGVLVLYDLPWFLDTSHCVYGYPHEHTGFETISFRLYMLTGCAFYTQALFTLLFIDEKLKDFVEMVLHHIATIMLITFCLSAHHHRVGSLVLILHDFVDIFLYSAKAFHHMNNEMMSSALFVGFTLSFLYMRLMLLPYIIYLAISNFQGWDDPSRYFFVRYVSDSVLPVEVSDYGVCVAKYCLSTYWLLILLLCLLVTLHIFWFVLVVKILIRTLKGTNLKDIREDEETSTKPHKD